MDSDQSSDELSVKMIKEIITCKFTYVTHKITILTELSQQWSRNIFTFVWFKMVVLKHSKISTSLLIITFANPKVGI